MGLKKTVRRVADKLADKANPDVWVKLLTAMSRQIEPGRFETYQHGDLALLSHTHAQSLLARGSAVLAFDDEIERHVRDKRRLAEAGAI